MSESQNINGTIRDLKERFDTWHRERTEWHSSISDDAKQQHYAEIGRFCDQLFPLIFQTLLEQDEQLKIAVEALEQADVELGLAKIKGLRDLNADAALRNVGQSLARLRSLSSPSQDK